MHVAVRPNYSVPPSPGLPPRVRLLRAEHCTHKSARARRSSVDTGSARVRDSLDPVFRASRAAAVLLVLLAGVAGCGGGADERTPAAPPPDGPPAKEPA